MVTNPAVWSSVTKPMSKMNFMFYSVSLKAVNGTDVLIAPEERPLLATFGLLG